MMLNMIYLSNLNQGLKLNGINSNIVFTLNQDRIQTVNSLIILNKDDYLININAWRCIKQRFA